MVEKDLDEQYNTLFNNSLYIEDNDDNKNTYNLSSTYFSDLYDSYDWNGP